MRMTIEEDTMKIALVGYGKMGHEIERVARDRGHEIVAIVDPLHAQATHKALSKEAVKQADVCIDFTHPDAVLGNVEQMAKLGKNVVLGTTGWYGKMDRLRSIVTDSNIGLIWASNFSIGVNMFFRMVEAAARIADKVPEYDVGGYELHHNQKADSPSGTAKSIAEILVKNIARKKKIFYNMLTRAPEKDELHMASVRVGSIPGTHAVLFDSAADTIELKHTARSRAGFALGAVLAAEFIKGKKGVFDITHLMDSMIGDDEDGA